MIKNFSQLAGTVKAAERRTVVVAAAGDEHALEAVFEASDAGITDYILVGDSERIFKIAESLGRPLPSDVVVHAGDFTESAKRAVSLVREGAGDFLMKGRLDTATLMRALLDREHGLRGEGTMSHVSMLEVPEYHKLLAVSDGGMIPYPTEEQLESILDNVLGLYRSLGYDNPKAAVLAASEDINERQPETVVAKRLAGLAAEGRFGKCVVEGPISFDLTFNREAAKIKNYSSPVVGDADILITPTLATGNILVKCLMFFGHAKMAGCLMGAKVPVVVSSRGASAEEKLFSILLCAAQAASAAG